MADVRKKAEKLHAFVDGQVWPVLEKLKTAIVDIDVAMGVIRSATDTTVPVDVTRAVVPTRPTPTARLPLVQPPANTSGAKLTGNALKIAQIAAGYAQRGEGIEKKLLAVLCGASMGGSFAARISEARSAGAIRTDGNVVWATSDGVAQFAGTFQAPSTTGEVLVLWRPKLTGTALMIFDHLVSLQGESISRADLATAVGASMGGSFAARLSEVRSTQLLKESGTMVAVNKDLLFM